MIMFIFMVVSSSTVASAAMEKAAADGPLTVELIPETTIAKSLKYPAIYGELKIHNKGSDPVTIAFRNDLRYNLIVVLRDSKGTIVWRNAWRDFYGLMPEKSIVLQPKEQSSVRLFILEFGGRHSLKSGESYQLSGTYFCNGLLYRTNSIVISTPTKETLLP